MICFDYREAAETLQGGSARTDKGARGAYRGSRAGQEPEQDYASTDVNDWTRTQRSWLLREANTFSVGRY